VLFIVAFVALLKTALNVGFLRLLGRPWPQAFLAGALLAQLGEFSFVLAALGLGVGVIDDDAHRLIVAVTVLSLLGSPFWLETARRLHRVALLGITSGRETVRIAFGREFDVVQRSTSRAEHLMLDMASGATRWVGDILPRRRRDEPPRR